MPTALANRLELRALSLGSAVSPALSVSASTRAGLLSPCPAPIRAVRVHSVFESTLNLEVEGSDILVALSGPSGSVYPYTLCLADAVDFRTWSLRPGDGGVADGSFIRLKGRGSEVFIDLGRVRMRALPRLRPIARLGTSYPLCAAALEEFQERRGCDLRLSMLSEKARAESAMGEALRRSVLALASAIRAVDSAENAPCAFGPADEGSAGPLSRAVAGLVGRGFGLTPAGDDFLCGFIAASDCARGERVGSSRRAGLFPALCEVVEESIPSTGSISASLLRCAMRGYWSGPLADLSAAVALDLSFDALRALGELCGLGHSSGADIATGFLYGLRLLVRSNDESSGESVT
jgi:hypothetical protein